MIARAAARLAAPLASLLASGCGGSALPEPVRAPPCVIAPCRAAHEGEEPVPVPYPPPPAKVDVIGDPPEKLVDPVWVDGQWMWRGRSWVWERGRWVSRPTSKYWAAPAIVRRSDGELVWFAGTFRPFGSPLPAGLPSADVPREKAPAPP